MQTNEWYAELKDFILSVEKKYRAFEHENMKWSPTIKTWLGRRWVIARLQKFITKVKYSGVCRYKHLQRAYMRQGLKGLNKMTQDELNIERKVCKKKA